MLYGEENRRTMGVGEEIKSRATFVSSHPWGKQGGKMRFKKVSTERRDLDFSLDSLCLKKSASQLPLFINRCHLCCSQQKANDYNVKNRSQNRWQTPKAREWLNYNITLNWASSLGVCSLLLIGQSECVSLSLWSIFCGVFPKSATND